MKRENKIESTINDLDTNTKADVLSRKDQMDTKNDNKNV